METMASIMREQQGQKAVEPHLRQILKDKRTVLTDHFTVEQLTFTVKGDQGKSKLVKKPTVVCNNVPALIEVIKEERGIKNVSILNKVGIDGGGGFFKVCLGLLEVPKDLTKSPPPKKVHGLFKDSGVKKLMIIGLVQNVPDDYDNVTAVLGALNYMGGLDFCTASDLKLSACLVGKQMLSCTFNCIWCEGCAPWKTEEKLLTLGRAKELVGQFDKAGRPWKKAMKFQNSVNKPLLQGPPDTLILDLLPPPELHLMLGVVNKIFDKLNEEWGEDRAYVWGKSKNIVRAGYRGGSLEGPMCKKLLGAVDVLQRELPASLHKFVFALKTFDKVRTACFGQKLGDTFLQDISNFKQAYMQLELSVTPKVHCVFTRVAKFCQKRGCGLGMYSEQASKSVHRDFSETWKRYKVNEDHSEAADHLF